MTDETLFNAQLTAPKREKITKQYIAADTDS